MISFVFSTVCLQTHAVLGGRVNRAHFLPLFPGRAAIQSRVQVLGMERGKIETGKIIMFRGLLLGSSVL